MTEMKDLPPAEFQIMEVLWQKGEATVKEVHAELSKRKQVAYNTVGTVLTRLRHKDESYTFSCVNTVTSIRTGSPIAKKDV
ncbi:MAG: BlaI/MecI/CopY family transcriptional regulator [Armatimonadetes bacterium]|nr:BlaI/MecI/CopY family transcriptional regulator [Armatimonadota bacterium]